MRWPTTTSGVRYSSASGFVLSTSWYMSTRGMYPLSRFRYWSALVISASMSSARPSEGCAMTCSSIMSSVMTDCATCTHPEAVTASGLRMRLASVSRASPKMRASKVKYKTRGEAIL